PGTPSPPAADEAAKERARPKGPGGRNARAAWLSVAGAAAVDAYVSTATRSVSARCTVGTKWKSALSELGLVLTRIIPTPPASLTARLLSTRALVPRSHTTIFPPTNAGSSAGVPPLVAVEKHNLAASPTPAAVELMSGAGPTAVATEAPK